MLFGPIFSVELVTTARRTRYLVIRLLCAAFLAFVLVQSYQSQFTTPSAVVPLSRLASFARSFFAYFTYTQLAVVLLLTPAMTAGTISLERERRTIEYLFATDLRNHEIVLGKLAARLVVVLCQVLAGLPILSIAMLLGGIDPQQLYMVFVITFCTALALAAFGIGVSVWTKRSRDAVMRAYVLLVMAIVVPFIVEAMLAGPTVPPSARQWLRPLNDEWLAADPLVAVAHIFLPWLTPLGWDDVWKLVVYQSGVGLACLVPAVAIVRRRHLKSFEVPTKSGRGQRVGSRRALVHWPVLWKEMYVGRTRGQHGWTTRIAMFLIVGGVAALTVWMAIQSAEYYGSVYRFGSMVEIYLQAAVPLASLLASLGVLVLAAWSAASITTEKERDTWVSLLCTPLSPREIVVGKILGSLYAARWILLLPLIVYAPAAAFSPDFLVALPFILATQAILCLFVTALGLLFSLKCRNTLRAMAGTLSVTFFLGGGYFLFCCLPLFIGSGPGSGSEIILTPCMPFLLAAPGIFYEAIHAERASYLTRDGGLFVAYLVGVLGYGVGALALFFVCIANFEELAGRSIPRGWSGDYAAPLPPKT